MLAETTYLTEVFMSTARYFCSDLITFGIYRQVFIAVPSTKSRANPSTGSRADTDGQTDGQKDGRANGQTAILWRHKVADNHITSILSPT